MKTNQLLCALVLVSAGCDLEPRPSGSSNIEISRHFKNQFGIWVDRPATQARCDDGTLTSTAYVLAGEGAWLYELRLSADSKHVVRANMRQVVAPRGTFHVATLVLDYAQTVGPTALDQLEAAQRIIQGYHINFARSRGFDRPIVDFDFRNVIAEPQSVGDPTDPTKVEAALRSLLADSAQPHFIVVINLDPRTVSGGYSDSRHGFIHIGNFSGWRSALSETDWRKVAGAAYLHEVAHHWGWPAAHDWEVRCGGESRDGPFPVAPLLFGWEDADADGRPDILESP